MRTFLIGNRVKPCFAKTNIGDFFKIATDCNFFFEKCSFYL